MIEDACHAVKEFMVGKNIPIGYKLLPRQRYDSFRVIADLLHSESGYAMEKADQDSDPVLSRLSLQMEEMAEAIDAVTSGDTVELFDALIDKIYSAIGWGIAHDFPMCEGFNEVHRSNMTKKPSDNYTGRLKDKGDRYSPPKLKELLERYRVI